MLALLKDGIECQCAVGIGKRIVVGVSGGADSQALAFGLVQLGFEVIVAHLDHGIREESADDACVVQAFAASLSVNYKEERVDTPAFAREMRWSLEEAARELRYEFLFQVAREEQAEAVVVGHNADDQVETIVMHFLRGAGLEGLKGMAPRTLTKWSEEVSLVRPMLRIWREEIDAFCLEVGLDPLNDVSNVNQAFHRNKIRHSLIPLLEEYNPGLRDSILRTSETLQGDLVVLESLLETVAGRVIMEQSRRYAKIDLQLFRAEPVGLQRRILRKAIGHLRPGLRDISFGAIQKVIAEVEATPRETKIDLIRGLCFRIEEDWLFVEDWDYEPEWPGKPLLALDRYEVFREGQVKLGGGWHLVIEIIENSESLMEKIKANLDGHTAFFDLGKSGFPLILRVRRSGDRIRPLGMGGHSQKISDYMINKGLLKSLRERWPILEADGRIIWVLGFQISDDVRVGNGSLQVMKISLFQDE